MTALHAVGSHEGIANIVKAVANGQSRSDITPAMIDEMNAMRAREHANVTTVDALALHKKNAVAAAALIHGLFGAQLDGTGTVLARMPSMTTQQVIRIPHCSARAAGRDDGQVVALHQQTDQAADCGSCHFVTSIIRARCAPAPS